MWNITDLYICGICGAPFFSHCRQLNSLCGALSENATFFSSALNSKLSGIPFFVSLFDSFFILLTLFLFLVFYI